MFEVLIVYEMPSEIGSFFCIIICFESSIIVVHYSKGLILIKASFYPNFIEWPGPHNTEITPKDDRPMGLRAPICVASNLVRANTPPTDHTANARTNMWRFANV